ncbi:MAG TPA: response regulator [Steroidobacteraceae bacterium]|jgi:CheY-like chemotaxis protein|nr:response regulator [Steroidobacteraceae bacterium]
MSIKTRVLHVRVVGFSAPERQMLNSIFLLSVAPARQIGYKLWNPEAGVAPDMYLLDGDSESAVASWQATFSSTSDRTLVVGSKNADLGVAAASRPLGLKVVGAMDRLAIALNNVTRESALHDVSAPSAGGTLPTSAANTGPTHSKPDLSLPRVSTGMTAQQPALSASMSSMAPMSASGHAVTGSSPAAATHVGTLPTAMTAAAPAATVLPSMTLQPNVAPAFDKSINEKPVTEKAVDRILSDKLPIERISGERPSPSAAALLASGVTPLSPSALSAAVAPTAPARANLRVVQNPSPLAASLPAAARIADAPMVPPPTAPVAVAPVAVAPVAAPPAPSIALQPMSPPVPVAPVATPTPRHEEHNFRVLAVDDSPLMRTFLQNKLQPYGIQPEFASSGEEALFKISKQHFDMIFLDVMLPGMDGYDVCKMIKKNKDNSLMKVVMLTSKDKTFDKIRGTMAGCDGYLTKPVDELKLRAIIERHTVTRK